MRPGRKPENPAITSRPTRLWRRGCAIAFWSGNGGAILVGATELNIAKWTLNRTARLVENTHSGTGGNSNYNVVVYDHSGTVEVPWDDAALPDTDVALVPGTQVAITFQHGNSGKTAVLTNTMVETLTTNNDNSQDIVRVTVTFKGGAYTAPTT